VKDRPFKAMIPTLTKLIEKSASASSQRAAAELMAGILRGSKHWDIDQQKESLAIIQSLFRMAITQATSESLVYWTEAIKFIGVTVIYVD
jgi:proteasome activator subunit 4